MARHFVFMATLSLLVLHFGSTLHAQSEPSDIAIVVDLEDATVSWTNEADYDQVVVRYEYTRDCSVADIIATVPGPLAEGTQSEVPWVVEGLVAGEYEVHVDATLPGGSVASESVIQQLCPPNYGADPNLFGTPPPGHTYSNDPLLPEQWALHNIGQFGNDMDVDMDIPQAWTIETGSSEVIVAIVDTGSAWNHPDLRFRLTPGFNFAENEADEFGFNPFTDCTYMPELYDPFDSTYEVHTQATSPHGVFVSGIIGGQRNNGIGVAGVAGGSDLNDGVRIMPFILTTSFNRPPEVCATEVFTDQAPLDLSPPAPMYPNQWMTNYFCDVLEYATHLVNEFDAPIRVVSSTTRGEFVPGSALATRVDFAVADALAANILIIAAAGNCGNTGDCSTGVTCPPTGTVNDIAQHPGVLAVSNCTRLNALYPGTALGMGSSCGPEVDISAPGSQIATTTLLDTGNMFLDPSEDYASDICGTSFAAPNVAGVAALLFSYDPNLSNTEARDHLTSTADFLGSPELYGAGRVNAYRALLSVIETLELPGDVNFNGIVDMVDATDILNYVLMGVPATDPEGDDVPPCFMNVNADANIDISDATYLLAHLFAGGPEPTVELDNCVPNP